MSEKKHQLFFTLYQVNRLHVGRSMDQLHLAALNTIQLCASTEVTSSLKSSALGINTSSTNLQLRRDLSYSLVVKRSLLASYNGVTEWVGAEQRRRRRQELTQDRGNIVQGVYTAIFKQASTQCSRTSTDVQRLTRFLSPNSKNMNGIYRVDFYVN